VPIAPTTPTRRNRLTDLLNSRSHHGWLLVLARIAARRFRPLRPLTSRLEASMERRADRENIEYDRRFGTDTFDRVRLADIGAERGTGYDLEGYGTCPMNESHFREIVRLLPVDIGEFTFFDVGSGKGKAVLLASDHPFRRIIGVELSDVLHGIAERNLGAYSSRRDKQPQVELRCADFLKYTLPDDPLVFFLNNPFPYSIAEPAIAHIERSFTAHPRPMIVVYRKPEPRVLDRLDASPVFAVARSSAFWRMYRSRPAEAAPVEKLA
jgi:hypothetical protein